MGIFTSFKSPAVSEIKLTANMSIKSTFDFPLRRSTRNTMNVVKWTI